MTESHVCEKGIISNLLQYSGIKNAAVDYAENESEIFWKWKNQVICSASQIPAKRLSEFDIKQDAWYAVIHWDIWLKAMAAGKVSYREVSKHPAVQRDIAIIIDKAVTYRQVQAATEQLKLEPLQSFGLFDIFESEKLGPGKKSFALSYTFQMQDRTELDLRDTRARIGSLDQQRILLDAHANPNQDTAGLAPLLMASENGDLDVVQALLAAGAAVDAPLHAVDEHLKVREG